MRDVALLLVVVACAVWAVLAGQYGFDPIFHRAFKGSEVIVPAVVVALMFIFMDDIFSKNSVTPTVKKGGTK